MAECGRCGDPNSEPAYKLCPDCRAYMRYQNKKSRAKQARLKAAVNEEPPVEVLFWPHDSLPEAGLRCRPGKDEGWYELI